MYQKQLRSYLAERKYEVISSLCTMARVPTVKGKPAVHAPYGTLCRKGLIVAYEQFINEGFRGYIDRDNRFAVVLYGGEPTAADIARSVGVFAHTDVVPAGEGWRYVEDPFSPTVTGGCVIGRGVEDNKAGVNMALWAFKFMRDYGIRPPRPIAVFLGADEESGMTDIKAYLDAFPAPTVSLIPDSGYPVCLGEKGIARLWVKARAPLSAVGSLCGGSAFNVILDDATARLSVGQRAKKEIYRLMEKYPTITAHDEGESLLLRAVGIAKHASTPDGSVNAAGLLCELLCEASFLSDDERRTLSHAALLLSSTDGAAVGIAAEDEYFGALTMANGMVRLEDGCLMLSFDVRYGVTVNSEEMQATVDKKLDLMGFDTVWVENKAGFVCPADGKEVAAILDVAEAYSGTRPTPFYMGGGTYARCLPNAYSMATYVPYVADPFPKEAGRGEAHQMDEHLPIAAHLEGIALFTDTLLALSAL